MHCVVFHKVKLPHSTLLHFCVKYGKIHTGQKNWFTDIEHQDNEHRDIRHPDIEHPDIELQFGKHGTMNIV